MLLWKHFYNYIVLYIHHPSDDCNESIERLVGFVNEKDKKKIIVILIINL